MRLSLFRAAGFILSAFCMAAGWGQTTYHVAVTGKDTNPGTAAMPWRTIQHACDAVAAGDTVVVHGGKYVGRVIVRRPMTLTEAAGESARIDGTGLDVPVDDSGLVLIKDVSNVTIEGFEISNYKTTVSKRCPFGILVEGAADGVRIRGNLIHNIENNGTTPGAINAFGFAAYGNSAAGAITNLVVDGNEIRNTKTGNSETLTVNGNVDGFQITNNRVHDVNNIGIVCIGFEGTSPIAGQDQARNGLVAGNVVSNVTSVNNPAYGGQLGADGIYVDGGRDILIERNSVTKADIGIEVASEHGGHYASGVIVRNNLVTSCFVVGLSIGGYASSKGGTRDCTFVNNTFYGNDTTRSGSGQFMVQFNTAGNLFANNILYATSEGYLVSTVSVVGVSSDYNLYFTSRKPEWDWAKHAYTTLASFSAGTGNDSHSIFANPLFADVTTRNFRLTASSPAVDKGFNFGVGVVGAWDLDGATRVQRSAIDLGCYELAAIGS